MQDTHFCGSVTGAHPSRFEPLTSTRHQQHCCEAITKGWKIQAFILVTEVLIYPDLVVEYCRTCDLKLTKMILELRSKTLLPSLEGSEIFGQLLHYQ